VKGVRRVILITGTPGVGKTTVSRSLASKLDAVYISLAELVERERLISGVDKARETLIADTDRVSKRMQGLIKSSECDVIVDGHYAVDVVATKDVHIVFVLRRDPSELKSVMENRGFKETKLWENIAAEILDVCLWDAVSVCGSDKVCEIDVSGRRIEDVVKDIILMLEGKKKCRVGIVDWLGKLEGEGRLREFLKPF
jgi:adenylate kinase